MQTKFPVGTKVFWFHHKEVRDETVVPVPHTFREESWATAYDVVWLESGGWMPLDKVHLREVAQKGILEEVQDTLKERGTQNGYDKDRERSAATIAKVFNVLTGRDITEQEAWTFMICLKLVRNQNKPRRDNIVDLIGYTALLGESQGEAI